MNDSFLNSANAPYVAELYFKYTQNPKSIDESWKSFFSSLNEDEISIISDFASFIDLLLISGGIFFVFIQIIIILI